MVEIEVIRNYPQGATVRINGVEIPTNRLIEINSRTVCDAIEVTLTYMADKYSTAERRRSADLPAQGYVRKAE